VAWAAVVLAGGRARRLGGIDKPGLTVAGRTLLDGVLDACHGAEPVVVVGPRRPTAGPVHWRREEPAHGGPLAALAAGLEAVPPGVELTAVLAADLPGLGRGTVVRLLRTMASGGPTGAAVGRPGAALPGPTGPAAVGSTGPAAVGSAGVTPTGRTGSALTGSTGTGETPAVLAGGPRVGLTGAAEVGPTSGPVGVLLVDGDGRRQWLCGVWRTVALRAALAGVGDPNGRSMRAVLGGLDTVELAAEPGEAFDVDTPDDLRALRSD